MINQACEMEEKFSLKWNDFESNISNSFSQLRQETELFDVTLVSSDQQQVSAHRLVLSTCSDFFKTIFHKNTHSHPLLYLDGVDSTEINLMLDYIYKGEVQIFQDCLERFMSIAEKFKLDGLLIANSKIKKMQFDDHLDMRRENQFFSNESFQNKYDTFEEASIPESTIVKERSVNVVNQSFEANNAEIESKFEELVVREQDKMYRCTVCNKIMKKRSDMKRHLETHLTGILFDCQFCEKTFRSSNNLRVHNYNNHQHKL